MAAAQSTSPNWTSQTVGDRLDYSVAAVGEQVLIAGGRWSNSGNSAPSDQVDIYDASTSTWSGAQLSQPRWGMTAASVGTQVVFAGGTTDAVDVYDSATGEWSTGSLSTPRQSIAAVVVGSQVLFAGGVMHCSSAACGNRPLSNVVDIYDSSTGAWSTGQLSSPAILAEDPFEPAAFTTAGTQALFWGASRSPDQNPTSAPGWLDTYDATTGDWARQANPFHTDPFHTLDPRPRAVVLGQRAAFIGTDEKVDMYDAGTGQWSHSAAPSASQSRGNFELATVGTRLLIAGGESATDVVDIYDGSRDQWSTAHLSQAHSNFAVTVVGTHAFFAGGEDNKGLMSDVVDIYDAATGVWSSAHLSQARWHISATGIGTHAIFAGGSIPGRDRWPETPSAVVDDFDLTTGAWSHTNLATPRATRSQNRSAINSCWWAARSCVATAPVVAPSDRSSTSTLLAALLAAVRDFARAA
jgi:hypothetical protein